MARGPKQGRWGNYSSVPVDNLEMAIAEILEDYGDVIFQATEDGLDKAAEVAKNALAEASPKRRPKLSKMWKVEGKGKYKLRRYIGNTLQVDGKSGKIALMNILEYSTTRGNPFVKETFEKNASRIAQIIVDEIKKEA